MPFLEIYVRDELRSAEEFGGEIDVDEYQRDLAAKPSYIGSYEVDVEGLNASAAFMFGVLTGHRVHIDSDDPETVQQAVEQLLSDLEDDRVRERRTLVRRKRLDDDEWVEEEG